MNAGQKIAHYEIIKSLGKGGMGEVFLAQDQKLERLVAVKVLNESIREDSKKFSRFKREAKASASLKHNNIAIIYSLEETDDNMLIVMEYIEGKTLSECIPSDGMKLKTFFDIFLPLADALAHAHEQGRIHRDLKPDNIMIAKDGTPKILDFGLALIQKNGNGDTSSHNHIETHTLDINSNENTSKLTGEHTIIGTPAYMSPEQIEGKTADARSDLFSFGIVMYEALTGKPPFEGSSFQSLIGQIMGKDPEPATKIKPTTPYALWQIVRRCLRKDRELRMSHSLELFQDLKEVQHEIDTGTFLVDKSMIIEHFSDKKPFWKKLAGFFLVLLCIVLLNVSFLKFYKPEQKKPVRKFQWTINELKDIALSPNGEKIAFVNRMGDLFIRDLDKTAPRLIKTVLGHFSSRPFWSSDSNYVGFSVGKSLYKVPSNEGEIVLLSDNCPQPYSTWKSDGTIVYNRGGASELFYISSEGGEEKIFLQPDTVKGEIAFSHPLFLTDNETLVYCVSKKNGTEELVIKRGKQRNTLVRSNPGEMIKWPAYDPTGYLLYDRGVERKKNIWALKLDVEKLVSSSEPVLVAEYQCRPSVSENGLLMYISSFPIKNRLVRVSSSGQIKPHNTLFVGGEPFLKLSPDRKKGVSALIENPGGHYEIWMIDLEKNISQQLTFYSNSSHQPVWSPDGKWIVFWSKRDSKEGIYYLSPEGDANVSLLFEGEGYFPQTWSPDGQFLICSKNLKDIWVIPIHVEKETISVKEEPECFLQNEFTKCNASFSPDGKYLVYETIGQPDVNVYGISFPGKQNYRKLVSKGEHSFFDKDGKNLFYRAYDLQTKSWVLMSMPFDTVKGYSMGTPVKVMSGKEIQNVDYVYGIAYDDSFIAVQVVNPDITVSVVENWVEEFKLQK